MYPGYFVAERDVAVVTVNYRLGIMGRPFRYFDSVLSVKGCNMNMYCF